jgi:L-threonylcarbamoyladenylate synthase
MRFPEGIPGDVEIAPELRLIFSSLENYARGLFHALRTFEDAGAEFIVAQWPSSSAGLGRALRDRLARASMKE